MNSKQSILSYLYLAIALAGASFTTISNIQFMKTYGPGFDIIRFVELANNNTASQSLCFDLLFLSSAIFIWMFIESRRLEMKNFWIVIIATFSIAIAFSAPLFLFFRERRLIQLNQIEPN